MTQHLLTVENLHVEFDGVAAVRDLSFELYPKDVLAIVGESGSGKSVTALALMRLVELCSAGEVTDGRMDLVMTAGDVVDLRSVPETTMRQIRGNEISMIFQEPLTSLNPVYTVGDQIAEVLRHHDKLSRRSARSAAVELMERVRIPAAEQRSRQYPHQMSGGMRQRVMIAMALACRPRILIADEPTTALDVTVQAQILALLEELRNELHASIIFITHDMGVVAEIADRVLVMRHAEVVETGSVEEIFARPQHPYTRMLLSAVPRLGSMHATDEPAPFQLIEEGAR